MTRKRSLPIAGKSLMPEILPDPKHGTDTLRATPRARVRARLRQLSDNAAVLAAAANLAACGTEAHEPAANSGDGAAATGGKAGTGVAGTAGDGGVAGKGGTGVTAGYGVVDPLPSPAQVCAMLRISSASAEWKDAQTVVLSLQLSPSFRGQTTLGAAMASGGVTTTITSTAQPYTVTLKSQTWPKSTQLTLAFTCTGGGGPTGTFMTNVALDTSSPSTMGAIKVTTGRDVDAGSGDAGI